MDLPLGWLLGVDGFPLGTHAAVAKDGLVTAMFAIVDDRGRAVDLEYRVSRAIEGATELVGEGLEDVRLVCLDDGGTGDSVARIGDRLLSAGIRFEVLVTEPGIRTSRGRARRAALGR